MSHRETAYVIIGRQMRVPGGAALELRKLGSVPREALPACARAATQEGFEMMFQFATEPDIKEVIEKARNMEVSTMDGMEKLWVLDP